MPRPHVLAAAAAAAAGIVAATVPAAAASVNFTDQTATLKVADGVASWMTYYFSYYDWTGENGAWDQSILQWHESAMYFNSILQYMDYSGNYGMVDFVSKSMYYATKDNGDFLFGCTGSCGGRWNDDIGWWALAAQSGSELFGSNTVISSTAGSSRAWSYVANFTLYQMLQNEDSLCGGGVYWSRD
ncbi:hydrolase 76 protein, partial [Cladochytrium tenue]